MIYFFRMQANYNEKVVDLRSRFLYNLKTSIII